MLLLRSFATHWNILSCSLNPWKIIIQAILIGVLGLFAFGDYIYRSVVNADLIPVPSVAGMDRQSAEAKLKDYGFGIFYSYGKLKNNIFSI